VGICGDFKNRNQVYGNGLMILSRMALLIRGKLQRYTLKHPLEGPSIKAWTYFILFRVCDMIIWIEDGIYKNEGDTSNWEQFTQITLQKKLTP